MPQNNIYPRSDGVYASDRRVLEKSHTEARHKMDHKALTMSIST